MFMHAVDDFMRVLMNHSSDTSMMPTVSLDLAFSQLSDLLARYKSATGHTARNVRYDAPLTNHYSLMHYASTTVKNAGK